jgi:hypothetical protein
VASAVAQSLNRGANAAGIGRGEREFLAIDLDGFTVNMRSNLAVSEGRDAGGDARRVVLADLVIR